MRLAGPSAPMICARCKRGSYVALTGRNAVFALIVLIGAFVVSFPSPLSDAIFGSLQRPWPAVVRAQVWSMAILLSLGVFMYRGPLTKVEEGRPLGQSFGLGGRLARLAFLSLLLFWMYIVWRGLMNAP